MQVKGGYSYFVTFIVDFNRHDYMFFVKYKSKFFENSKNLRMK